MHTRTLLQATASHLQLIKSPLTFHPISHEISASRWINHPVDSQPYYHPLMNRQNRHTNAAEIPALALVVFSLPAFGVIADG